VPDRRPVEADVWVQAVSVGEVGLAATFVGALSLERPGTRFLVTSSTPAGVALLPRRLPEGVALRPFPLDLPSSVRRFLSACRCRLLVLVETELWPAVLREAERRRLPVLVVNGRLSERSLRRLRRLPSAFLRPLDALAHVAARSAEDASRFATLGIPEERIAVAGDLKLDGPEPNEPAFAGAVRALSGGRPVLVAGSIAEEEVAVVLEVLSRLGASGKAPFLLLAPRQPGAFDAVARAVSAAGLALVRRSSLGAAPLPGDADVFLLDTLGELAGAYLLGDVTLLGGTFGTRGGHNVLEPLRAGVPTVLGPSTWNITDALAAAAGAVFTVASAAEATDALRALLEDPASRARAREAAGRALSTSRGAARRAAAAAVRLLEAP